MQKTIQITIFGATGFIGRHLVQRLAKTGAIIRVPTRDAERALRLKTMGDVGQIVPLQCSMRSDLSVKRAIGDSDIVINLVGILYEAGHDSFQTVHVEMAARIARLAKECGAKKFIQLSALGADVNSKSRYAQSKAAGEQAVQTFFSDAIIIRPSIVFGPEDSFFNLFASLACLSPFLPLIGGGQTKFQPIYVGDVADAICCALEKPEASGQIFELGGTQVLTFRDLLEMMLKQINRHRCLIKLPFTFSKMMGAFLGLMPRPLLTRDQVELLKTDNIVRGGRARTLKDLGLIPRALEVILPSYLGRFRKSS